jgi:hypothetical protein
MDFKRLKASSICHRPRYISNTVAGAKLRSKVVKTKVYAAASMVSGLTWHLFYRFPVNELSLLLPLYSSLRRRPFLESGCFVRHPDVPISQVLVSVLPFAKNRFRHIRERQIRQIVRTNTAS